MTTTIIQEKIRQAALLLGELEIDCWITFVRETQILRDPTLDFLVPADLTWQSALIVTSTGTSIAIVGKYDAQAVRDTGAYTRVLDYIEGIRAPLLRELRALNPQTIALNYSIDSEICDGISHGMFLSMMAMLEEVGMDDRVMSAEQMISALRQRKSPTEVKCLQEAIRHTEEIYSLVAGELHHGMTEEQTAAIMRDEVKRRGLDFAWDPNACPAVFTGPDTAAAHYRPTDRVIRPGHVVNMDFGVRVHGYVSDMQRSYYVLRDGETVAPVEVQRGFATIVEAIEKSRAAMKPGVTGNTVDALARAVLSNAGYEEFPHALGHQVGRFAHDGTALLGPAWEKYGRKPFYPLEENMIFTLEPRLTVPGHGVVTVEEMVIVRADGAEFLSVPQTQLHCIQ
jgi:Xaa-Pro aminopeptidase